MNLYMWMYANENSLYMFNIDTNPMKMWDVPKNVYYVCLFVLHVNPV